MSDQISINVTDLVPPANIATIDKDGLSGNAVSKDKFNTDFANLSSSLDQKIETLKEQVESDFKGTVNPSSPAPTEDGSYKPEISSEDDKPTDPTSTADWGTKYPNLGNLRAKRGYYTMFYKKGTVWTRSETKMPEVSNNVAKFADLDFPAGPDTQTLYNDIYWYVLPGQSATITDIPNDDSTIWKRIGEAVSVKSYSTQTIKSDTYTSFEFFASTNVFAAFGFAFASYQDFNQTVIKVGQISGTAKPVTEVNIRICEESMTGTELARAKKTVSIAEGDIVDVAFDHALITNPSNKVLWVEFWTNGRTGLFKGNTAGTVAYKYKSDTMAYADFPTQSADGASPKQRFYLVLNKVTETTKFKDSLISKKVSITDTKPVESKAVAEKIAEYDAVITDGFVTDSLDTKGTITMNVNNSTFKGWGQIKGKLTNFNRLGYMFKAFDATMIPTQVTCVVRETNSTGPIIFNQTKNVSLELNVIKNIYFDLPETYINTADKDIFVSFIANGMISLYGGSAATDFNSVYAVKYTTALGTDTLTGTVSNLKYQMYCEVIKGHFEKQLTKKESDRIRGFGDPDVLYTSKYHVFPGSQLNIYNKNVCVPQFGDNNDNYVLNYDGPIGKQYKRQWRLDPVPESMNQTMTLYVMRGREVLANKVQNLLSVGLNAGNGVTRDFLLIADSTGTGKKITGPLMDDIFANDVMKIRCIGEQGPTGYKNEAISGARIDTFYTAGLPLYKINLSAPPSVWPGLGSVYSQGANTYRVDEVNPTGGTGGSGYFSIAVLSGSGPSNTGALNKVSGSGDAIINYSSITQPVVNKFFNPSTNKFDFAYYLSATNQTFASNGTVAIQIGINEIFSAVTLADAQTRVDAAIVKYNDIIASIHAYDSTIRIGIIVTFPPTDQNAFGENYSNGQYAEMYRKTGLVTWQKRLHQEYDNTTSYNNRVYLIPVHLSLDTENDFPEETRPVSKGSTKTETVKINAVHPDEILGSKTIAMGIAGLMKFFA